MPDTAKAASGDQEMEVSDLTWLRLKLSQWGHRSKAIGIGFPSMSTTERARIGRGGVYTGPALPPDLELLDLAVSKSQPQHKLIVVETYTKDGYARDHAVRLRLSLRSYWRRRTMAETHVSNVYDNLLRTLARG